MAAILQKFATQADARVLAPVREIASKEGKQLEPEVEDAVMEEAREEARKMIEVRLQEERVSLTRATEDAKRTAEDAAKVMLAEQEKRIRAEMESQIAAITAETPGSRRQCSFRPGSALAEKRAVDPERLATFIRNGW